MGHWRYPRTWSYYGRDWRNESLRDLIIRPLDDSLSNFKSDTFFPLQSSLVLDLFGWSMWSDENLLKTKHILRILIVLSWEKKGTDEHKVILIKFLI